MVQEGFLAGCAGALAVALVFLTFDAIGGAALQTPSALGTLLFYGAEDARSASPELTRAVAFNAVHLVAWIAAGMLAAWIVAYVERHPVVWYLMFVAVAFSFGALLWLDGALGLPGLGRFHLIAGGLVGAAAMSLYLWHRHPALLAHLDDVYGGSDVGGSG